MATELTYYRSVLSLTFSVYAAVLHVVYSIHLHCPPQMLSFLTFVVHLGGFLLMLLMEN